MLLLFKLCIEYNLKLLFMDKLLVKIKNTFFYFSMLRII